MARLVALLLVGALANAQVVWSNWAKNQQFRIQGVVNATTEVEVAAVLANNSRVKAIGAAHSFSGIDGQLSFGVMLNLVAPADPVTRLSDSVVRAHAGLHLWELNELLEARWGLALQNLGAIANQTIAGATSTNTHGTGPTGGLSSFITGFTCVLANGTTIYANNSTNADIFVTGRTGYGALFILTWVELSVVPLFLLERIQVPYELSDLLTALPALRKQYDRVEWWYTPYKPSSAVLLVRGALPSGTKLTGCWPGGSNYATPLTPPPAGMSSWPAKTVACSDVSYKVLSGGYGDNFAVYTEMEMMVDDSNSSALVTAFLAFQDSVKSQWNSSVGIHTGMRYVTGDDITLSPFNGRPVSAVLSMVVYGTLTEKADAATVLLFDQGLQKTAIPFGARPHPGKNNYFTSNLMEIAYSESTLATFVGLWRALDPHGMFSNAYLQLLFGSLRR